MSKVHLSSESSRLRKILNVLLIIALAIMIVHTLIYIAFGVALIPFPFDYDQAEGYELNNAVLMAEGGCPYCDNDVFPFYGSGYPPFFHILMIPFVWIFGPQLWYGRLIIFASTFITTGAIAYAVHRSEKHRRIAILAGLAFLASNYIYHIGPLLRQHLLMVMFETLAVVIVANAFSSVGHARRKRLLIAFTILLIAGYTKQLSYATSIAVFLWVFIRNPRTAIRYALGLIVGAAIVFAAWMLITDGQWFVNIISANQNPYITEQFTGLAQQFIRLHWALVLMALLVVAYELYFSRFSVYSIWFIAASTNTILAGKWGAGDSYFDTMLVAACLLSGIFLARTINRNWQFPKDHYLTRFIQLKLPISVQQLAYPIISVFGLGLFIVYGLTVLKLPTSGPVFEPISQALGIEPLPSWRYPLYDIARWTVGYAVTGHLPTIEDYENGWAIIDRVNETDGLLMSEDASFSFRSGREVITNGIQMKNLWENGLYDPAELLGMIEDHEFGLIIIRAWLFPPPINEAIQTHYQLDETIPMNGFEYELWRPN